ncbi:hypothetical protein [Clostridium sp.]|uniref:hypothetical protein n=1 Tax=Clostridium sp. TaxID=1506 RepID=UPI0028526ACD|nr:hypothetical protein [Clostridium sp.]
MELKQSKRKKEILIFFLVIDLILLPTTLGNIAAVKEKPSSNKQDIKKKSVYSDDINIWINNIFDDNIEEAHIANNSGDIIISNFDKVSKLSLNPSIRINDINLSNNEKYKLGVSLNE